MRPYAFFALAAVISSPQAWAWRSTLPWERTGESAAVEVVGGSAGEVVVFGVVTNHFDDDCAFTLAKLRTQRGAPLWMRAIHTQVCEPDTPVGVDRRGDVFVGGINPHGTESEPALFTLRKLSGTDGAELWRYGPDGGALQQIALTHRGDVVAAGWTVDVGVRVIELAGESGVALWRREIGGIYDIRSIALDSHDDVLLAESGPPVAVLKLSGRDGTEIWRRGDIGPADAWWGSMTVDQGDDTMACVVSGEWPDSRVALTKLSARGDSVWRTAAEATTAFAVPVLANGAGDLIVVRGNGRRLVAEKISGVTGERLWKRIVARAAPGEFAFGQRIVGGSAGVAFTGFIGPHDDDPRGRFVVGELDDRSGAMRWHRRLRGRAGVSDRSGLTGAGVVAWPARRPRSHVPYAFAVRRLGQRSRGIR